MQTLDINFNIGDISRTAEVVLKPSPEGVIPVMYKEVDLRSAVDFMLAVTQLKDVLRDIERVLICDLKIGEGISYLTHRVKLYTECDDYGRVSKQEYRLEYIPSWLDVWNS